MHIMDFSIYFALFLAVFFLIHWLYIFVKNKPTFLSYLIKNIYPEKKIIKAYMISSLVTSVSAFVIAFLIYTNKVESYLIYLILIIWSVTNMFFLGKTDKRFD